jgi:hypothetical protein
MIRRTTTLTNLSGEISEQGIKHDVIDAFTLAKAIRPAARGVTVCAAGVAPL